MVRVWHNLLEEARNQDKLRTLLQQVMADPNAAITARLTELLAKEPVIEAAEPGILANAEGWHGSDDAALERQILEQPTLLDAAFLAGGLRLAPAVCRLLVRLPSGRYHGTGLRIGPDLLLSNHHVLFDRQHGDAPASEVEAWFGYENDALGRPLTHQVVTCRPETIVGGRDHGWAAVRVASSMPSSAPVVDITAGLGVEVYIGDRVHLVLHPNGGVKKLGLHHNVVAFVDADVLRYWTDSEAGSPGSPIFDQHWRLVALHQGWIEHPGDGPGQQYRNQGRRITRVAEGLAANGLL